ncbi:ABC transporter permease [Salinibacterium sp. M195]|uniref:ABC transporter permease n=1 Tax=Salinibacterium sp. M195 TaxID=2583374 RepID=UPI001C624DEC|nr:ABC transporter permease [Salinibacterium sp. M195]QYH34855.1 ABC transporter permease [Salinibacterium sp. M195]
MRFFKELLSSRELLSNLTLREIRGKYKRTVFGQLWSLANPLALMLIYTFVFSLVFRIKPDVGDPSGLNNFALWLLCGLLPFTFLSTVITKGVGSLVENAVLIQKVSFNRIVLPLSLVGSAGYNWMFEMGVLVLALTIAVGVMGSIMLQWIPLVLVAMLLLAVFGAGLALMLSVANVYFRDTQWFVTILLQMWLYLSPVIYPSSMVADVSKQLGGLFGTPIQLTDIYGLNPMVHFLDLFRNLLYDNRWPDVITWLICLAWAVGIFIVGVIVFRRNERNLAETL